MKLRGKVALVTGASSGIGRATALELARRGSRVAVTARRVPELEQVVAACRTAGAEAALFPADLSVASDCCRLIAQVVEKFGTIDVLINNAGFGVFDRWADVSTDDVRRMFDTNFFGAVHCTLEALPIMLGKGSGAIVNVASIAGLVGFPRMGAYCASKFALVGFSESLRDEVIDQGVTVSAICPATTSTEFFLHAEKGKLPGAARLAGAMRPERVARAICAAAEGGRYRNVMPGSAAAFVRLKEFAPRTAHFLLRKVSRMLEPGRD